MSCNCKTKTLRSPDGEALPLISTEYNLRFGAESEQGCCGPKEDCSVPSNGADVPANFLDTICANEDVVLLTRKGGKWSRFTKSGFIQLIKGKAKVVSDIALKANTLWHNRYRPAGKGLPILGEPLDSPYDVIADAEGNLHAQKGVFDEDSVKKWDADLQSHVVTPVSELPKTHKGLLPYEGELEIVGFVPIASNGSPETVRQLHVLSGAGIIVVEQQATIPSDCNCEGCVPVPALASVAKFLPNPTGDGVYTLKFSVDDGHYWEED